MYKQSNSGVIKMYGAILMSTALASFSLSAFAAPPKEVLERIQRSFTPGFSLNETSSGRSLNFCRLTDVQLTTIDPVHAGQAIIQIRVYHSRKESDRSVILLPPTGGENILDQGYANHLCAAGFNVALLQSWTHQTEATLEPTMHDFGALRSLSAIRHTLDYLKPTRKSQVGILGTSVGAISSSLALGFDERLNNAVLIVGGLGFPEIVARSTEQGAAKLREARMQALGMKSMEEYVAYLQKHVTVEPGHFSDFSGPKKVLAFVGTKDVTVPTQNQRQLVEAYAAESNEYEGDHTQTILNTFTWKRGKIAAFFEENLK
jgi:hypothetical protein